VKHGIENNQELAHTSDERGLGVFTIGTQPQIESSDLGQFPAPNDNAVLFQFPTSGKLSLTKIGFSKVLGVAFDSCCISEFRLSCQASLRWFIGSMRIHRIGIASRTSDRRLLSGIMVSDS